MANAEQTMIRGYVRRMREVAKMATELQDIERKFQLRFGKDIKDCLVEGATRDMVERTLAGVAPGRPESEDKVPVPTGDTTPYYGGAGAPQRRGASLGRFVEPMPAPGADPKLPPGGAV